MSNAWYPDISGRQGPRYVVIADAIGDALAAGRLTGGMQLPTQRDLARRLNVTIGTVSRAYQEAERRGFVTGEVGRGTYIRENAVAGLREQAEGGVPARPNRPEVLPADDATTPERPTKSPPAGLYSSSVVHLFRRSGRPPSPAPASRPRIDMPPTPGAPEPLPAAAREAPTRSAASPINLASSRLPDTSEASLRGCLDKILSGMDLARRAAATVPPTDGNACRAASRILERLGVSASSGEIVLAPSGTAALDAVLSITTRAGDSVLVEALMDPTVRAVATRRGLRLNTVQIDREGAVPESFELACWSTRARYFLISPTAQNPTATTLSNARRAAIVEIAERYDVTAIEWRASLPAPHDAPDGAPDGTSDGASDDASKGGSRALAALAPHRTVHVADLGACALAGLRLGTVTGPADSLERIAREIVEQHRLLPGLLTGLLETIAMPDAYETLVEAQRRILAERRSVLARALGDVAADGLRATDSHGWLRLPDGWRSSDLAVAAAVRGVLVTSAEHFQPAPGPVPRAVRLAWGGASGVADAATAGAILAQILAQPHDNGLATD